MPRPQNIDDPGAKHHHRPDRAGSNWVHGCQSRNRLPAPAEAIAKYAAVISKPIVQWTRGS